MKKNNLTGLGSVFRFTLLQHYKSRATIVTLAIFLLFAMAVPPVGALVMGGNQTAPLLPVTSLYLENETGLPIALDGIVTTANAEKAQAAARIFTEDGAYRISLSGAPEYDTGALTDALNGALYRARMRAAGATDEQLALIGAAYGTQTGTVREFLNPSTEKKGADAEQAFSVTYAYSILVMMLCLMSSSYIIASVVEEKTSKLVELIMVSVSPMAMIVGKILAVMCYMFIGIAGILTGFAASYLISARFLDVSFIAGLLAGIGLGGLSTGALIEIIAVVVISLLLGYMTLSLFSGILGAGCSSTDDMQSAVFSVLIVVMTCYLISIISVAFESNAAAVIFSLIPVLSVFCAPAYYALGSVGLGVLMVSWLLQAAVLFLLTVLAGRVYRNLILYNGNRLGLKRIIVMAKGGKIA